MVVKLLTGGELFSGATRDEEYDEAQQLHEIASIFEPFPISLLDRIKRDRKWFVKGTFGENGMV
jgi:hypothetical protein